MNELLISQGEHEEIALILNDEELLLNGKKIKYELHAVNEYFKVLRIEGKTFRFTLNGADGRGIGFIHEGENFNYKVETKLERAIDEISSHSKETQTVFDVKSPMPGLVLKVKKRAGDLVHANESVIILEAMKMENDIKSPSSGIIKELMADEKQSVEKGSLLFRIEQLTN